MHGQQNIKMLSFVYQINNFVKSCQLLLVVVRSKYVFALVMIYKAAFPRLVFLTNAPIILRCTGNLMNTRHNAFVTGLFRKVWCLTQIAKIHLPTNLRNMK